MLKLSELFLSLQGETDRVGLPTVFIRLSGCPIRCRWCDTDYAFKGGTVLTIDEILSQVKALDTSFVTVTGGEPLAQKQTPALLTALCDVGFDVSLETGGMLDISSVDKRVCVVLDIKTPSSEETDKNRWQNLPLIKPTDQIKFVIGDKLDYEFAKQQLPKIQNNPTVLFSPVADELNPTDLAEWILADRLSVRFQLQMHKILWNDSRGK